MNKIEKALSQLVPANSTRDMTLIELQLFLDIETIDKVFTKIKELIDEAVKEHRFFIILGNDFISEYFIKTDEDALDDDLIEFTLNYLKREGYTVISDEIIYDDFKSIIEIRW